MFNHECPHCHNRSISTWRAIGHGMAPITCRTCGTEVVSTWWSVIWTTIPFLVVYVLAWNFISLTPVFVAVVTAALLASLWLSSRFVVWTEKR